MADTRNTVVVSIRNRPVYLWACLDALYRLTASPARFVLVDNASDDQLVAEVIRGFVRRGMVDEIVTLPRNDPALLAKLVMARLPAWGPIFTYVEADAVLLDRSGCWLADMLEVMHADPLLAMLGTLIDRRDFIDLAVARQIAGDERPDPEIRRLIKYTSSERLQDPATAEGAAVFRPHSPAGRFMMLRTDALQHIGAAHDSELDARFRAAGYRTGIATNVTHRHLSLLHLYDRPDYDLTARDAFMQGLSVGEGR